MRNLTARPKRYSLDESKIKRARKLLGTKTDAETIDRALDEVITELSGCRADVLVAAFC